jgi:hypothetical protein
MLDKIKREMPRTLAEWLLAIVLFTSIFFIGSVTLATFKLLWSYILS